ncbi:M48 family metallopeptidase [Planktothrix sp. FACHB-1355]|uniref:M48 family metallopeptidase n=1 Tax=Aerosakkonema funiforme FACHB-1375 TaxID=2949571 RepID=A0A926VE21_9CYAN|nr:MULTISPECIES: SprT family zinc-dependent metalloprotease [Oscillatoriales]MBD2181875.1 M48 family metallopeptidase [Aerosakkonema funiforme FACHB-1375]MBD3557295.1 M48 family metallopeptidase [Planktothrix sp. FACHB-1355]
MPMLQIGKTNIPYTVRESSRAKHQRIVVTPEAVEVVVPPNTPGEQITAFLDTKRHWLFNAVEDCRIEQTTPQPQSYVNGAKIPYRGRRLLLKVENADVDEVVITCKSSFYVQVPRYLTETERHCAIVAAFERWMRDRAEENARSFATTYARKLNIKPPPVRLADQKHTWGTCGKDGIIRINWHLIQAPKAAMEYVIAHEVVHLLHRHHGDAFWETLSSVMSDWQEQKTLLESWERRDFKR